MNAYLDLIRQGKTGWWRFVLAVALILFLWQILGALPSVFLLILVLVDGNPQTGISPAGQFVGVEPVFSFAVLMLASVFFLVGIFLAVRFIHQRPFRTLITPARLIAWKRFFQGFAVWFVLSGLMSLVEALLYPGRYVWTLDLRRYIPFVFLALVLIPIQTSAEELFFRGYILQGVGLRLRNIWVLSAISGFLFMLPHLLNPEARVNYGLMGFYYFFIGAVMAFVTLQDGRLELALGLHAANNLFAALFANYTVTVMPTPSLFTINTLDAVYSVSAAVIGLIVFVLIFMGPLRRRLPDENLVV
ncbi:MAG TPA: type II CAAX endopeptidase family protein [Anaerolineaceae bacterium]